MKQLLRYYKERHPAARVRSHNALLSIDDRRPNFIKSNARSHKYILLQGRRIVPSDDKYSAPNSIIQSRFGGHTFVGQVIEILSHEQRGVPDTSIFVHVRWFGPLSDDVFDMGVWNILYVHHSTIVQVSTLTLR